MGFVHPRGEIVPFSPSGVQKRHGPCHSVQQLYNVISTQVHGLLELRAIKTFPSVMALGLDIKLYSVMCIVIPSE